MSTISGKTGKDVLKGTTFADKILGYAGDDMLYGNAGDDFLDGGTGNDYLDGGTGNDTVNGGTGNDNMLGGTGNDQLVGGDGNDKLDGGAGNDQLTGGNGNDILSDSSGTDTFVGGTGFDTLDYSTMTTGRGVDVFLSLGIGGRDAAGDHYSGIENVTGTKFQDFLWGDSAANTFVAGGGNDYMRGFDGNDVMSGGDGNDEFYGDAGSDLLRPGWGQDILDGGSGSDWADYTDLNTRIEADFVANKFVGPLAAWGSTDGDQFYNVEGVRGTNNDDSITLSTTPQVAVSMTALDGAGGNDVLQGAKLFYGGMGEDKIKLDAGYAQTVALQYDMGIDKIVYFDSNDGDKLLVNRAQFGLKTDAAGNTIYNWVDTTDKPHALAAGPAFIYETTTQILWFDADGTGSKAAPVALAGFYAPLSTVHATDLVFVG